MKARREGTCPKCKGKIHDGDRIESVRGRWYCGSCADTMQATQAPVVAPSDAEVQQAQATVLGIVNRMLGRGAPVRWDNMGFNKMDFEPMSWLADNGSEAKPGSWGRAVDSLRKYSRQLGELGMWNSFEEARGVIGRWLDARDQAYRAQRAQEAHQATQAPRATQGNGQASQGTSVAARSAGATPGAATVAGDKVQLRFPYNPAAVDAIKALPTRRWVKEAKCWEVPISLAREAAKALDGIVPGVAAAIREVPEVQEAGVAGSAAVALCRAMTGDQAGEEGAAMVAQVEEVLAGQLPDGLALYPFQAVGVGFLQAAQGKAIVGDEMGCGKTIEALAYLLAEHVAGRNPWPAIVVVPATLKRNWKREAERWLGHAGITVEILNGHASDAHVQITNYEAMRRKVVTELVPGQKRQYQIAQVVGLPEQPGTVIVDECHRVKNQKAQQTRSTVLYAKRAAHMIFMSGTPLLNRPEELWVPLSTVAPDQFPSWWRFTGRYCDRSCGYRGQDVSGASHLDELRNRLRPIMLRRTKDQVLKELGPKRRATLTVELSNRSEYDRAEADVVQWLADQAERIALAMGAAEPEAREEARRAAERAERAEHLVRMNKLRILAGVGKVGALTDWISDFVQGGRKLVVFSHHHEVIAALRAGLEHAGLGDGIVELTGRTKERDRQAVVDRFQQDPATRIFIGTTPAGGVGITLTAASDVIFMEREWVPGIEEQAEDRCHRIGQDAAVTCWYSSAEATVDQDFEAVVDSKRAVFARLVDGKVQVQGGSVIHDVTRRMAARHAAVLEDYVDSLESAGALDPQATVQEPQWIDVESAEGQAHLKQLAQDEEDARMESRAAARDEWYVYGTVNGRD